MDRYESRITVTISGLTDEGQAHGVNEAVGQLLTDHQDVILGDLVVAYEVLRYDESDPDADAVVIWPTDNPVDNEHAEGEGMTETERLKKLKAALQGALLGTLDAESFLEEAAELCELTPDKAEEIWQLKGELGRLGARILQASKV